jgi:hypothetical protein
MKRDSDIRVVGKTSAEDTLISKLKTLYSYQKQKQRLPTIHRSDRKQYDTSAYHISTVKAQAQDCYI